MIMRLANCLISVCDFGMPLSFDAAAYDYAVFAALRDDLDGGSNIMGLTNIERPGILRGVYYVTNMLLLVKCWLDN